MQYYATRLYGSKDGKGTKCEVIRIEGNRERRIGESRMFKTYPAGVRARNEGEAIARRIHRDSGFHPETFSIQRL